MAGLKMLSQVSRHRVFIVGNQDACLALSPEQNARIIRAQGKVWCIPTRTMSTGLIPRALWRRIARQSTPR